MAAMSWITVMVGLCTSSIVVTVAEMTHPTIHSESRNKEAGTEASAYESLSHEELVNLIKDKSEEIEDLRAQLAQKNVGLGHEDYEPNDKMEDLKVQDDEDHASLVVTKTDVDKSMKASGRMGKCRNKGKGKHKNSIEPFTMIEQQASVATKSGEGEEWEKKFDPADLFCVCRRKSGPCVYQARDSSNPEVSVGDVTAAEMDSDVGPCDSSELKRRAIKIDVSYGYETATEVFAPVDAADKMFGMAKNTSMMGMTEDAVCYPVEDARCKAQNGLYRFVNGEFRSIRPMAIGGSQSWTDMEGVSRNIMKSGKSTGFWDGKKPHEQVTAIYKRDFAEKREGQGAEFPGWICMIKHTGYIAPSWDACFAGIADPSIIDIPSDSAESAESLAEVSPIEESAQVIDGLENEETTTKSPRALHH